MAQPSYTYRDAYVLINAVTRQQEGFNANIQAVDTSSFIAVANRAMQCGVESLFKAMSAVIGRTIFSSRPYKGKLQVMRVFEQRWGEIIRKVVYLSVSAEPTTSYNTLDATPLENGKSVDMYQINNPGVVQLVMNKVLSLQVHITRFKHQIYTAMRSESEYLAFWDGMMTEFANDIESMNEARRRLVSLNAIAGANYLGNVVDLAAEYNKLHGTAYTREQLLSVAFKDFTMFSAGMIKKVSRAMTDRTNKYQQQLSLLTDQGKYILHHTPYSKQRLMMYAPLLIDQETTVFPTLFGPDYLKLMQYEEVNYWQNPNDPSAVTVTPVVLNSDTGEQMAAPQQSIPYVAAYLFDDEHMGVCEMFEESSTTPYNSAGKYWNIFVNWLFQAWNDFTEKHVLFIIGEGGAGQDLTTHINIDNESVPVAASGEVDSNVTVNGTVNINNVDTATMSEEEDDDGV